MLFRGRFEVEGFEVGVDVKRFGSGRRVGALALKGGLRAPESCLRLWFFFFFLGGGVLGLGFGVR